MGLGHEKGRSNVERELRELGMAKRVKRMWAKDRTEREVGSISEGTAL